MSRLCHCHGAQLEVTAMYLSLNCLIHGEDAKKVFTVQAEKSKNVYILKELIKEKKALNHVDASDLELWGVDLRLDELGAEPVQVTNLDIYVKLSPPLKKVSFFFTGDHVDDDCLHIIAKVPASGMSLQPFS